MARYRMEDGTVVDTLHATASWQDREDWDGRNWISRATGSQWTNQKLYRSRKGRYYIEHTSQWQGSRPYAEWVSPQEAAEWLLLMEEEIPEDLRPYVAKVSE
jgi:hypothetical protein